MAQLNTFHSSLFCTFSSERLPQCGLLAQMSMPLFPLLNWTLQEAYENHNCSLFGRTDEKHSIFLPLLNSPLRQASLTLPSAQTELPPSFPFLQPTPDHLPEGCKSQRRSWSERQRGQDRPGRWGSRCSWSDVWWSRCRWHTPQGVMLGQGRSSQLGSLCSPHSAHPQALVRILSDASG